jgi:hypothetical protein
MQAEIKINKAYLFPEKTFPGGEIRSLEQRVL